MSSQLFFPLDDEYCHFVSGDDENSLLLIRKGKKYCKIFSIFYKLSYFDIPMRLKT